MNGKIKSYSYRGVSNTMYVPSRPHHRACYPFSFIPLRSFCYCFPLTKTLARPPRTCVFKGLPYCLSNTFTNPPINRFWLATLM